MNTKIVNTEKAVSLAKQLRSENQKIVLAGGCFDILHIGHISFLEQAKKQGDILLLLLEADETISKTKGPKRPINTQKDRATILSALTDVDYVVMLTPRMTNDDYDTLISTIHPDVIATTQGDPSRLHKERQARLVGATVVDVIMPVNNQSTTKLIHILEDL